MTKLALGTVQFGLSYGIANRSGKVPIDEVARIISSAESNGIDTLDTAISYGDSESVLGQCINENWQIVTKLPPLPKDITSIDSWVNNQISEALSRLRKRSVYGLMLHNAEDLVGKHGTELNHALHRQKEMGVVRKIGVSIYDPRTLEQIVGKEGIDLVQAPVNVLDRRLQTSGWLTRLKEMNIEVHARSIFLQGLLLMSADERPKKFLPWNPLLTRWDNWLRESGHSALEESLGFIRSLSCIDKAVIGVQTEKQLLEIIKANHREFIPNTPDELSSTDLMLINPSNW